MELLYGECPECHESLYPVWFTEEEYKTDHGVMFKTGRKRNAVDYLLCESCGRKETVDSSFDGKWY